MKTSYLILFLTILTTGLFSQSLDADFYRSVDNIHSTNELEKYKGKFRLSKHNEENLNSGVVQTTWFINKGRKSNHTYVLTLSIGNQIFYKEVYRTKLNDDFDGLTFEKLHVHADSVILQSIKSNDVVLDVDHLERFPHRSTFGYACSYSGSMPDEGLSMLKFVEKKDTTQLINWLMSINPVKQTYSYLGLKLLQSKDSIELTTNTMRLMTDLEKSSSLIYFCSGCTIWEYLPIYSFLAKEDVMRFVEYRRKK